MLSRTYRMSLGALLACALGAAVAGCGGSQSAPANNAASPMTETQKEQAALPLAQMAPIPRGLHCKSEIVWVNLSKKTYHEEGDPYYGRTKHGEYICKAAADAEGDHLAGSRHGSMGSENTNGMSGATTSTGTTRKHHRRSTSGGGY